MAKESIQVGKIIFDVTAALPNPAYVTAGSFFFATDTQVLYINTLTANVLAWKTVNEPSSSFVVGPPGSGAQFSTIQAAINAAVAAGFGQANPATVYVLPSTYVENPIMHAGIFVTGAGATLSYNDSADLPSGAAVVSGTFTNTDETGDFILSNVKVLAAAGIPFAFGGVASSKLWLSNCVLSAADGVSNALKITNTHAASRVSIMTCKLINAAAGAAAVLVGAGAGNAVLAFSLGSVVTGITAVESQPVAFRTTFQDTQINGIVTGIVGNLFDIKGGTLNSATVPNLAGAATYTITGPVSAPSGIAIDPAATVATTPSVTPLSAASLVGAGPHTLTTASANTTMVTPAADAEVVVNLPSVTTLADGYQYTLLTGGSTLGAAVIAILANGAQTIGTGTSQAYRMYEGGTVTLRANRSAARWDVVAEHRLPPANIAVYVATTGSDTGPGTAASPYLTIDKAWKTVALDGALGYQHINIGAGTFTEAANTVLLAAPRAGVNSEPPCLIGTMADSGLGALTVAGSSAGAGSTFATVTDTVGGLVVNAWQGYILRYTSGAQAGKEYVIDSNTANVFTLVGTQVVPVNGDTYVVESPATDIQCAAGSLTFRGGSVCVRHVSLNGGLATTLSADECLLSYSASWFLNHTFISLTTGASLSLGSYSSLSIPKSVGARFQTTSPFAAILISGGVKMSQCSLNTSFISGLSVQASSGERINALSCSFRGTTGLLLQNGAAASVSNSGFETVSGIAGQYNTSCIQLDNGSSAAISNVRMNNSVAFSLSVTGNSVCTCSGLTGATNAGVPVSLRNGGKLLKSSANTITGAVAGNDVQIGGDAASSAWAAVNAGLLTDLAAAAPQICLTSN